MAARKKDKEEDEPLDDLQQNEHVRGCCQPRVTAGAVVLQVAHESSVKVGLARSRLVHFGVAS